MSGADIFSKTEDWVRRRLRQDAALIAIVAIFFAGLLPMAATRVVDTKNFERYFTDTAVLMLQSGDLLTPHHNDGTLRLHKPPLVYWLMIACYKLLGISFFSSRILFLAAACATIWLTHKLALELTDANLRVARVAALILMSNLLFITVAPRAVLDISVTFSLALSAIGFLRLICQNDRRARSYWLAYGGAALGIATKGVLPIVFVAYAIIFAVATRKPGESIRRLFHPWIIVASVIIAAAGSAVLLWKHGPLVLQSFWSDQVGEKTGAKGSPWRIFIYLAIYLPYLMPWLFCLGWLSVTRKPHSSFSSLQKRACWFIIAWAILLAIVFGLGDRVQDRYLAPALPLLAVVIALGICRFSVADIASLIRPLLAIVTVGFLAAASFGIALLWQNRLLSNHFAGVSIVALVVAFILVGTQSRRFSAPAVLAISLFLFLPLSLTVMAAFTLPDQTTQVTRALESLNPAKAPVYVVGTNKLTSRLRVSSGARYPVLQAKRKDFIRHQSDGARSVFVFTDHEARQLSPTLNSLQKVASYPLRLSVSKLVLATLNGESRAYLQSHTRHCYAAVSGSDSLAGAP